MDRGWLTRCVLVLGLIGMAGYFLYPSYYYFYGATEEQQESHDKFCDALPDWMVCSKFSLGLDLQGGIHLVMGVGVDKAVEQRADRLAESLGDSFEEEKLADVTIERPRGTARLALKFGPAADVDAIGAYIRKNYTVLEVTASSQGSMDLELIAEEADRIRTDAVEQTIKTLRNRADQFGVTEPTIARRGSSNILIQLPGVKDPQRALDMIGRTAQLEFKIVDGEGTAVFDQISDVDLPAGVTKQATTYDGPGGKPIREVFFVLPEGQKDVMLALLEAKIPTNRVVAFGEQDQAPGQEVMLRTYLLNSRPGITGDYLKDASVQRNPDLPSDYYVSMDFDQKGAKIFEKLTEENARQKMAIVLDNVVSSAPQIEGKIAGGSARITLGGVGDTRRRYEEATDLTLVLKAGALPAPVEIREKRQVGKTLGAQSVEQGTSAIILGFVLVIMFMVFYYKLSGLVANLALVLNIVFVMALLSMFDATLTLPGMAGIVLTIGMAVDANVIIFERIREELRVGKTPRAAIDSGYGKAFSTIMDANITTLIAGVVLMQYGSGPVRGFAVTLIIGIICSMFTAIVVTRLVYDFFSSRRRLQSLSI